MKTMMKKIPALLMLVMMLFALSIPAYAAGETDANTTAVVAEVEDFDEDISSAENSTGDKAKAAALAIGLAAAAGAIGMGIAIAKSVEGISRQPEAEGKIRTSLMLGLVFVETAIIYALIVAILIIFVL